MTIESEEPGGFLHLLPIFLREGLTCTGMSAALLPWGSVSYMALLVNDADDKATPGLEIAYEWPNNWLRMGKALTQAELEWLHVQRFRSDHVLGTRTHPFVNVQTGGNPPDVVVDIDGRSVGMECTRFTVGSRLAAHGLFRTVRQRVIAIPPEHFAALSGHVVYLWFNGDDSLLTLPYRKSDEEAAAELVQALADYRPDPAAMWVQMTGSFPDPAPAPPLQETTAGAIFYCLPMTGSVPDSVLFNCAGFEVGLAYTTSHQAPVETARLVEQIARKDRPESDWLLISAGAPDNFGITYPAEEALADFVLNHGDLDVEPVHLSRVTLHFWSVGRAVDLWPERREVFGPLYHAAAPAARQIKAQEPSQPNNTAA